MGASSAPNPRGRGMIVGINVTPMVDVVLVLLVLMMVSANYIVSRTLKVDLPNAQNSDGEASSTAAVTITRTGELHYNREPVTEAELTRALVAASAAKSALTLIISADAEAQHGRVVTVLDLARSAGVKSFAVNVERKR